MKIIIFIDYSKKEFNIDFDIANRLIKDNHIVLLITNQNQLEMSYASYDILFYGNSYNGNNTSDKIESLDIKGLNYIDIIKNLDKKNA